ncbi:hypothetical protein [Terrabacter sp. 2YAF2]|uniref:hypothetical protein n=1 Tax=Terrabacter sp. 2YAF2 TaxID=3233026 RepID=UPI003F96B5FC
MYIALVVAGVLAYAGVVCQQLDYGLEYDEAYNLTVVRNLAEGHGYASNSAMFPGVDLKSFDPFVSTGPALLVPAAVVWRVTGGTLWAIRLVPLVAFAIYLLAAWLLGKRLTGRTGGLLAVLSPLALATAVPDLTTLSLVPGRVVGEVAACGLSLLGVWALVAGRPFSGGLAVGLAVQAKANFLMAAALVLAIWVVGSTWPTQPVNWRATCRAALGAVLPTAVFELYRLTQLGPEGYLPSVAEFAAFLRAQSRGPVTNRAQRLESLVHAIPVWGWLFVLGALVLAVVSRATRGAVQNVPRSGTGSLLLTHLLVLAPAFALLGSWLLVSVQSSVRQGLPFLLLLLPLVGASVPLAARHAHARAATDAGTHRGVLGVAAATTAVLGVGVAVSAFGVWTDDFGQQLAAEQRSAASAIVSSRTRSLPVSGWWQAPEMQVLTGLRPEVARDASPATVRVFTSVQALLDAGRADARVYQAKCGDVLYASTAAVVCREP